MSFSLHTVFSTIAIYTDAYLRAYESEDVVGVGCVNISVARLFGVIIQLSNLHPKFRSMTDNA
jgi:hypothetical protein